MDGEWLRQNQRALKSIRNWAGVISVLLILYGAPASVLELAGLMQVFGRGMPANADGLLPCLKSFLLLAEGVILQLAFRHAGQALKDNEESPKALGELLKDFSLLLALPAVSLLLFLFVAEILPCGF